MGIPFASDTFFHRSIRRKKAPLLFLAVVGLWTGLLDAAPADGAEGPREYDLKAVLLYHLTRFVEWPETAFSSPDAPLVIGILGQDPYGKTLDDVVRMESCGRHKIEVVHFRTIESVRDCQILLVGANEQPNLPRILRELAGRPILSVGEFDGFGKSGGMVRLYQSAEGKIKLRINLGAVRAAKLTVSGKLLQLAETIYTGEN